MQNNKIHFWDPYLKGIGQIMLQDNTLTGLLFFIGIFLNSITMAIACLVSVFVGTMTAKLLKYDEEAINSGLYGFNATLVGVGLTFNFQPVIIIWIAIIVFSALSTIIMNFCLQKKIPIFTFPFIILLWISLYIFHNIYPIGFPPIIEEPIDILDDTFSIMGHGLGFGEVIFQGSLISGIIFFLAVYINSPIASLYGLFGVILSVLVAAFFKERIEYIKDGLFGFNAVLCAIVFSGLQRRNIIYVIIAVMLSVKIEDFMLKNDMYILTFPFVLATWITLFIRDVIIKKILPN